MTPRRLVRRDSHEGARRGRTCRWSAVLVVLAFMLAACGSDDGGSDDAAEDFPMTIENCGREISLDEPPERVMAMGGEAGSLLWAAGAADRISTYTELDGEPVGEAADDLAEVPQVLADDSELSREVIIGEEPDLVISYGLNATSPEDLADAGIPTIFLNGRCDGPNDPVLEDGLDPIEALYEDIELYGQIFGTTDEASEAIEDMRGRVDAVEEQVGGIDAGSTAAALFVPPEGVLGAYGNAAMAHAQLEVLGFTNVFDDEAERYFEPSVEAIIDEDPDVLLALYQAEDENTAEDTRDLLLARDELAGVGAINEENILPLDFFYSGNGFVAIEGLEILAEQLGAAG